jgi:hypothetical protein
MQHYQPVVAAGTCAGSGAPNISEHICAELTRAIIYKLRPRQLTAESTSTSVRPGRSTYVRYAVRAFGRASTQWQYAAAAVACCCQAAASAAGLSGFQNVYKRFIFFNYMFDA